MDGNTRNTIEVQVQELLDQIYHVWLSDPEQLAAFQPLIELKREEQRVLPPSDLHMPAA